jgi:putative component of membrane protein insertase Oxa1/YidC/SpoIIIJ protein YidD
MTALGRRALWVWDHTLGYPLAWALIGLVGLYRVTISPLGSLRQHGSLKGSVLVGYRLLRCNPWSGGGVDPVPSRERWRPDILPDGRPRVPMASS